MSVEALQKRWRCRSNGNEADECWQTQSTKYKLKSGIKSETKSETKSKLIKFATLRTYPPTFPFPVSKVTWQCVLHRAPCLRECAIFFIRRRCLWLSRSRRLEADPSILYGSAAMLKWPATPALSAVFSPTRPPLQDTSPTNHQSHDTSCTSGFSVDVPESARCPALLRCRHPAHPHSKMPHLRSHWILSGLSTTPPTGGGGAMLRAGLGTYSYSVSTSGATPKDGFGTPCHCSSSDADEESESEEESDVDDVDEDEVPFVSCKT